MRGKRKAVLVWATLVGLLLGCGQSYGQDPIGQQLEWWYAPVVRIDSAWVDYRFAGLAQVHRGAQVLHEATHGLRWSANDAWPEPYLEQSVYVRAPFAVDGIPAWLREDAHPHLSISRSREALLVHASLPAFRLRNGEVEVLSEYRIGFRRGRSGEEELPPHFAAATQSVLATGQWAMLAVEAAGVYKLTYERLQREGFNDPAQVTVWGHDGQQLPYENSKPHTDDLRQIPLRWVVASGSIPQPGDYALCYLPGSSWWQWDHKRKMFIYHEHEYDEASHFFITDGQPAQWVEDGTQMPGSEEQTSAWGVAGYIGDKVNLVESGRELLSEAFRQSGDRLLESGIKHIDPAGETRIHAKMAAASRRESHFDFYAGTLLAHRLSVPGIPAYLDGIRLAQVAESIFTIENAHFDGSLRIALQRPTPSAQGWIGRISINTHQRLEWTGDNMEFYTDSISPSPLPNTLRIAQLPSAAEVWDVTNAHAPVRFAGQTPWVPANRRSRLIAFTHASATEPHYLGAVPNQNLHGMSIPEMLIVSHADFLPLAHSVAQIYRESPLTQLHSEVVDVEQVYREFSSGNRDAGAIRNLVRMLYWRGGGPQGRLRYLLIVGSALYTLKDAGGDVNYVPNYQSANAFDKGLSYGTDDFYGLLDPREGGGLGGLDLGVGRYSVFDQATADAVLAHERAYHNPTNWGDWVARMLFLSDDGDENVFTQDAETLARYIETASPSSMVTRIHADAFRRKEYWYKNKYPHASAAVNAQIERGAFLFNYLGHAHPGIIGHEGFIEGTDIDGWRNLTRQPIFVAASCLLARYDYPKSYTIGEAMLFSPQGGMAAMIASSRIAYSNSNYNFNTNLTKAMFPTDAAQAPRSLGDAFYRGKARTVNVENKRKYALLGNPALPFPNPNAKAVGATLNGKPLTGLTDTVRAGSFVRMGFTLQHADGRPFNGEAFVSMQGPRMELTTHGNNDTPPVHISEHVGTAFRGKVTVSEGRAEATWRVPIDMDCDYQPGKVNVVGTSPEGLCLGSYSHFTFGGRDNTPSRDRQGPVIELTINDWAKRTEWHVSQAPLLIARLRDSSGISLSQLSPLSAQLVGPEGEISYNLNDFYTADKDSYQQGEVRYRLSSLDSGQYRLTLTAHDTQGNSSQASIAFHVVYARETKISRLLNYPNPFTQGTAFYFDTSKPGVASRVLIQVYTVDGQVVKTIHAFDPNPPMRMGPFHWDGRDDYGQILARGVYFYRVRLTPLQAEGDGAHSEQYEKLLKL